MNLTIHPRNFELAANHRKLIERQAGKMRKLLATFNPEVVDLTLSVSKLPRGSQYQTSLVLTLPQRTISVEEIENNPVTSAVRAFAELRRRIKRFKSQLSRERLWHRQPTPSGEEQRSLSREIENQAAESLDKIENYVRREIFHQVLSGTMPPGILEPQALVDEIFLYVTTNAANKPPTLSVDQWVFQNARMIARSRIQEVLDSNRDSHVEEPRQREESQRWEDEQLNFYQPDEALQLEDFLVDDKSSNPEEIMERDEAEAALQRSIARLPGTIRESFVLFALEGFTSDEVAMITGNTPEEVVRNVEAARDQLRQDLRT